MDNVLNINFITNKDLKKLHTLTVPENSVLFLVYKDIGENKKYIINPHFPNKDWVLVLSEVMPIQTAKAVIYKLGKECPVLVEDDDKNFS